MIVSTYAAVLALIFVFLSVRTLRLRRLKKIIIGTRDDPELTRAIRAHSNFAEYAPIGIILIYLLESQTQSTLLIHVLGLSLVSGRLIHAYGISQPTEDIRFRVAGMALTLACIISGALRLIIQTV